MNNINVNNYIIIGGVDNKDILKWGEMQDIGLATGHKVIEIKEHGVIIKYENKFIPNENIWKVFKNRKDYLKWLRKESDIEYYYEQDNKLNNLKNKIINLCYNDIVNMIRYGGEKEELVNNLISSDVLDMNILTDKNKFENNIYKSKDGKYYLYESRLFNNYNDNMNAFLQVFNSNDISIYKDYIDDVWSFSEWEDINS